MSPSYSSPTRSKFGSSGLDLKCWRVKLRNLGFNPKTYKKYENQISSTTNKGKKSNFLPIVHSGVLLTPNDLQSQYMIESVKA